MGNRKHAVSTMLKLEQQKVSALEKELSDTKSRLINYQKESREFSDQLEQVHQVLDAVANPVKRESEGDNSWDRVKGSAVTRLAAWLSQR